MKLDVKQRIIDRLLETRRENVQSVIDYMEKHGFFRYHCHSHHRYEGGLADHAWQTYQIALVSDTSGLNTDSIAIATILHDLCDCSGMRDITGHGRRSAGILKQLGFKLTQDEFLAIRFHIGLKNKKSHRLYREALDCRLGKLVHKSDGKSAGMSVGADIRTKIH